MLFFQYERLQKDKREINTTEIGNEAVFPLLNYLKLILNWLLLLNIPLRNEGI